MFKPNILDSYTTNFNVQKPKIEYGVFPLKNFESQINHKHIVILKVCSNQLNVYICSS